MFYKNDELEAIATKLNEKYLKNNYRFKDCLYIISSDPNQYKFKDIDLDIYEGDAYDIKHSLIRKRNMSLIESGVELVDIDSTYIDYDCEIGKKTVIYPNTYIQEKTKIGNGCIIKGSLRNSIIKNNLITKEKVQLNAP